MQKLSCLKHGMHMLHFEPTSGQIFELDMITIAVPGSDTAIFKLYSPEQSCSLRIEKSCNWQLMCIHQSQNL